MRALFAMMMLLAAAVPGYAQSQLTNSQITSLSSLISMYRISVRNDRAPVSYCAIKEFWDGSGALLLDGRAAAVSMHKNRSECPDAQSSPDSASAQGVVFSSLNVFADSVVINAVTTRASGNFVERYSIARIGGILVDPQYSVSLSGDGTLDDNIAQAIGDFVSHVRVALLADPTPVSYCLVNEMWDSSGRLLLKGEAAAKSKYTDRRECPAESEYNDRSPAVRVTIGGTRVYPDSIVIYGLSQRGGGSFPEHYLIVRSGNRILAREYSLSFIFTS